MRLVATIVGLFLAAAIFAVGSPQASAQAQPNSKPVRSKVYVTVKPGDSLSKIAERKKTTYKRIFFANKQIKDPDLIYPDQKLRIPNKDEKLKKRALNDAQQAVAAASERTYKARSINSRKSVNNTKRVAPKPVKHGNSVWDRLAACESGGNWNTNTGNGYYGGLQFLPSTWRAVGGKGLPHQASREEQIKRGKILQARSGWGQWPACSAKLGLR